MKMYLIAIVVAIVGLWASSQAQAKDYCGQRSATLFAVQGWEAKASGGNIDFKVLLKSGDEKAIARVGGTIEFIGKAMKPVSHAKIVLAKPVEAGGLTEVSFSEPATEANQRLLARTKNEVHVLACVDSVEYVDGSGAIVN